MYILKLSGPEKCLSSLCQSGMLLSCLFVLVVLMMPQKNVIYFSSAPVNSVALAFRPQCTELPIFGSWTKLKVHTNYYTYTHTNKKLCTLCSAIRGKILYRQYKDAHFVGCSLCIREAEIKLVWMQSATRQLKSLNSKRHSERQRKREVHRRPRLRYMGL